jgi:glyceraldehyde-3-phosphate dehydrogenase/erythrose-4-phosphate dehydrogenase
MNTIPTSFSPADDISTVLTELTTQASAVLASVPVVQNAQVAYKLTSDPEVRDQLAIMLRKHGVAMETVLRTMKLNANLINEERLEEWTDSAESAAEMQSRKKCLQTLCEEMENLGKAMAGLRNELDKGDEMG